MTDHPLTPQIKPEEALNMNFLKPYLQAMETKIVSNIESHSLSSEKRIAKLEKMLSELTINYSDMQGKLNDNKIKCLKIDELYQLNQKLADQIASHDTKINKHTKDVHDSLNKFDQILIDNLTIPGLVGSYCKFKSIREFISYNNQQINNLLISKNKIMNEIEKFQKKIQETIGKFSMQIDKMTNKHSSIGNTSFIELKNGFDESIKEANEHFSSSFNRKSFKAVSNDHARKTNSFEEEKKHHKRKQFGKSQDNKERNDLRMEIKVIKREISLIKEKYFNAQKGHSRKNIDKHFYSLETIRTKSPLSTLSKFNKKKGELKANYSFSSHQLNTTERIRKEEEIYSDDQEKIKTVLTCESYDKKTEETIDFNDKQDKPISLNNYIGKNGHAPKGKFKSKEIDSNCSNSNQNQKKHELVAKEKTKEIPYNRSKRNRIQTQMFCERDKISLLQFEKKKKIGISLPVKKELISKVRSVDNLKARFNPNKSSNNKLLASNEIKESKHPNKLILQINDKLQIDCSASPINTDDQRENNKNVLR